MTAFVTLSFCLTDFMWIRDHCTSLDTKFRFQRLCIRTATGPPRGLATLVVYENSSMSHLSTSTFVKLLLIAPSKLRIHLHWKKGGCANEGNHWFNFHARLHMTGARWECRPRLRRSVLEENSICLDPTPDRDSTPTLYFSWSYSWSWSSSKTTPPSRGSIRKTEMRGQVHIAAI